MAILKVVVLALIQGFTEFIPVSSTGHLIIFSDILKTDLSPSDTSLLVVFLHVGTLLAVVFYYREKLYKLIFGTKNFSVALKIIIATIPAVLFGVIFAKVIEPFVIRDNQYLFAASELMITGLFLIGIETFSRKSKNFSIETLPYKNAFIIGLFQSLGIFYGISRSGITLVGTRFVGLKKGDDVDFTFLISIPAIFGAIVYAFYENITGVTEPIGIELIIIGTAVSTISGYFAIDFLIKFLKKYSLKIFGVYCLTFGFIAILIKLLFL